MTRIVIIGVGSNVFIYNMVSDAISINALNGSNLVLHDIDKTRLKLMYNYALRMNEFSDINLEIEETSDREEALINSDFVLLNTEIEQMKRWRKDWEIPFKHGIKQVIGENGGLGGLFHTLRNIPLVMEIVSDMECLCPNALLINYTNPVSRICLAISRYSNIKVIGLSTEVDQQLKRISKLIGVPTALLDNVSAGLNHFSWYKELKYKDGTNVYPILDEKLKKTEPSFQPLCRAMYNNFGLYPSTDDIHMGEYLAYAWDLCPENHRGIKYIDRMEFCEKTFLNKIKKIIEGEGTQNNKSELSGERAMHIIAGVIKNSKHIESQVNLPNKGQITNLIENAIVETPAIINKDGIKPIQTGKMPPELAALCNIQILVQSLSVEAGVHGNLNLAKKALLSDPVIQDNESAEKAFNELFLTHCDSLPQFSDM